MAAYDLPDLICKLQLLISQSLRALTKDSSLHIE